MGILPLRTSFPLFDRMVGLNRLDLSPLPASEDEHHRLNIDLQKHSTPQSPLSPSTPSAYLTLSFFLLGVGSLLPFNALLSVLDYYSLLFPSLSVAHYITNAYSFPFMLSGIITALFPPPVKHRSRVILFSYFLMVVLSVLFPTLTARHVPLTSFSSAIASPQLIFILILTASLGIINSFDQSTLFGVVGLFPGSACTTAYNAGGAVASVLLVSLRAITRALLDENEAPTPRSLLPGFRTFFAACAFLCAACVLVFAWMSTRSAEYAHHVYALWHDPTNRDVRADATPRERVALARETLGDIKAPAICMLSCFVITLMLFPGIMAESPTALRASASPIWLSWFPLVVVAVFALGDTAGRIWLPDLLSRKCPSVLVPLSAARVVATVPLAVAQWAGWLPTSWLFVLLTVFAHAYLNGVIMNMAFLVAPNLTSDDKREVAGRLMFLTLNLGLFLGSASGWLLEKFLVAVNAV